MNYGVNFMWTYREVQVFPSSILLHPRVLQGHPVDRAFRAFQAFPCLPEDQEGRVYRIPCFLSIHREIRAFQVDLIIIG